MDASGPKGPPAVPVSEKPESQASGVLAKVDPAKRPKRKTREEKRAATLQMIDWATSIDGKHPNLIHNFLTSKDERVQWEAFKFITQ